MTTTSTWGMDEPDGDLPWNGYRASFRGPPEGDQLDLSNRSPLGV